MSSGIEGTGSHQSYGAEGGYGSDNSSTSSHLSRRDSSSSFESINLEDTLPRKGSSSSIESEKALCTRIEDTFEESHPSEEASTSKGVTAQKTPPSHSFKKAVKSLAKSAAQANLAAYKNHGHILTVDTLPENLKSQFQELEHQGLSRSDFYKATGKATKRLIQKGKLTTSIGKKIVQAIKSLWGRITRPLKRTRSSDSSSSDTEKTSTRGIAQAKRARLESDSSDSSSSSSKAKQALIKTGARVQKAIATAVKKVKSPRKQKSAFNLRQEGYIQLPNTLLAPETESHWGDDNPFVDDDTTAKSTTSSSTTEKSTTHSATTSSTHLQKKARQKGTLERPKTKLATSVIPLQAKSLRATVADTNLSKEKERLKSRSASLPPLSSIPKSTPIQRSKSLSPQQVQQLQQELNLLKETEQEKGSSSDNS